MLPILKSILFLYMSSATALSEGTSYAKVSRNGQLARDFRDSLSWTAKTLTGNDTRVENESRGIKDIAITVSPVYVPAKIPKLKKGEAADYPITSRYSTLNHEIVAKLEAAVRKNQIQQRFHPPASFDHSMTYPNGFRPQKGSSMSNLESSSRVNSSSFPGPILSGTYEYSPPEFLNDGPMSDNPVISIEKYPSMLTDDKIPNSYKPHKHQIDNEHETDYPNFDIASLYDNEGPAPKPLGFANYHGHSSTIVDDSHGDHEHDLHHDIIYDHIPEYHEYHKEHTTMEPEMNDQRLDKRPYSYYFIGKKLWYIPLYFSIYFIIYIAALVLKSIARHKINFPTHLAEAANHSKRSEPDVGWWNIAEKILEGIERFIGTSNKVFEK